MDKEEIYKFIKEENWLITTDEFGQEEIEAYGEKYKLTHPLNIHLKLYRECKDPTRKFFHMKKAHDYLWPDEIWHYWTERRFKKHCEGWSYIVYAGGASTAKSNDAAKLVILWYLANPQKRAVIIASTTLESLNARIWGYVKKYLKKIKIPIPLKYTGSPTPKILYETGEIQSGIKNLTDTIHGMFAIAAKKGDDDEAIASWIGRHPEDGLILVLDEATDMPLSLLKALPNLKAKSANFQCMAIGNSNDKFDLHGTLATPKNGWESVDPYRDIEWLTTQENGLCLFFSCYESPAIHEADPILRKLLAKFLITSDEVRVKEIELGKESDAFMRFVLGFWKKTTSSGVVIPSEYFERYHIMDRAEWSGMYPIHLVAGLDPSFSSGGDKCVLRLAMLGVDIRGKMVLDFRGNDFLFRIPIIGNTSTSAEIQICDATIDILQQYGIPLNRLAYDANGGGRGLGETMRERLFRRYGIDTLARPYRTFTTRLGNSTSQGVKGTITESMITISAYDLWFNFLAFIEKEQIRGLDSLTAFQLSNRKVEFDLKSGKPKLESKQMYKTRIGNIFKHMATSPDEADAGAHTLLMAKQLGFYPGQEVQLENEFMLQKMYHQYHAKMSAQAHGEKSEVHESGVPSANFSASIESLANRKWFP